MRNLKTNQIFFFLFTLLIINSFAQDKIKIDGVIAVVGKHIVLQSDIEKFKIELEQSGEGASNVSNCEIMEQMMQQKLLAHHAEVDSLEANEASVKPAVERKLEYFKQQTNGEEKLLALYGFDNMDELKEELVRIEIEQSLIGQMQQKITSDISVTPEEVRNYFNSLKSSNSLPEFSTEVKLAQLVINVVPSTEEIDRIVNELSGIKKEIEDGANMKMKAILYSDDPGVTQNGGLYTITRDAQFIKEFKDAAFALDEGQVSEPFESMYGYHIVKVEKVRGQEIDVRHILIQPKITELEKLAIKQKMDSIKIEIGNGKLTFEEAVKKYSQDTETNKNKGIIINPYTNESTFKITGEQFMRAFPNLHSRVYNLNEGQMSDVFYDEDAEGKKMFKLVLMKEKLEGHTADFVLDYVKIQNLTLAKKKQETIEKWINDKVKDTFIKIDDSFKDCDFKVNFNKTNL
jgi:peptidyl-prolyl cis-trans isomerase SurA